MLLLATNCQLGLFLTPIPRAGLGFATHSMFECPLASIDWLDLLAQQVSSRVQPEPETCCFTCYLPTRVCQGLLQDSPNKPCLAQSLVPMAWWLTTQHQKQVARLSPGLFPASIILPDLSHQGFAK